MDRITPGSTTATSAMNLASLLDLSSRISETDSMERILNAALLSVMGKLRIRKACVMMAESGRFEVSHGKGVPMFSIEQFEIDEPLVITEELPYGPVLLAHGLTWLVPLVCQQECLGLLAFGPTLAGGEFDDEGRVYIELLRTMTGVAVHNARTFQSLVRTQRELRAQTLMVTTLFESARDFTAATSVTEILRILTYRLMGQLMISSFVIWLEDPVEGERVIVNRREALHLEEIQDTLQLITSPVLTSGLDDDSDLRSVFEKHNVAAATPVTVHMNRMGVLAVCEKLDGKTFTQEELSFIESIGNAAMIALENDRLFNEELEKQRLEQELDIAASIQRGLFPLQLPATPGFEVAADTRSSKKISGDYYDVIILDSHRTLFAIADVVGKGIPAALLMANVQAALNVLAHLDLSLAQVAERLNKLVCDNTEPDVFVTMFLAIADGHDGVITYVNAGHNPPVVVRDTGNVEDLTEGGVLIGVINEPPPYREGVLRMNLGDTLVLYTDGVTEAQKGAEEYGEQRLIDCALVNRMRSSTSMLDALKADVEQFTGTSQLHDDTSILIVRRIHP